MSWSKFHTDDQQMLGDIVQNSSARGLCTSGCKYIIEVNNSHAVILNSEIVSILCVFKFYQIGGSSVVLGTSTCWPDVHTAATFSSQDFCWGNLKSAYWAASWMNSFGRWGAEWMREQQDDESSHRIAETNLTFSKRPYKETGVA